LDTIYGNLAIGIFLNTPHFWGIYGNPQLTSLSALQGLSFIQGNLEIWANTSLASIEGLDNINSNSISSLYIQKNPHLSTCEIRSICDFLASSGYAEIDSNDTGCNSPEEVDSACVYLSTDEINIQHAFSIYPNPASATITISTPTTPEKNTFMTIFNISGRAISSRQITEKQTVVDLAGLPQGVYFVRVTDESKVQVGKIIRQ